MFGVFNNSIFQASFIFLIEIHHIEFGWVTHILYIFSVFVPLDRPHTRFLNAFVDGLCLSHFLEDLVLSSWQFTALLMQLF